ncbi:MGH1-like glycoside hydrolase domain-containing protein [Haloferula sp. A504]|uniref:MGH1-like glycoside hydrolase domain-containing protein n=1 Tax=Haloferula sp. A504 TaxID=3373601 RepID=UPI0031C429B0|nr:glucosidase [Verrucomicrobiaceae bacterium E54]
MSNEHQRLAESVMADSPWRQWGPYLSERQWGTVREDYSASGFSWGAFPHDHARMRAYRWGEDGLQGWSDNESLLCFSPVLWNGRDPILKERLFGLGGHEGNHGEDVKECYYYLDSTPTHSYTKALYKYPQCEFPYSRLQHEALRRSREEPELELAELGVFDDGRYFDVLQEVAKRTPNDILWKITVTNHGPEKADLHLLPQLWFRNVWSWKGTREEPVAKPTLQYDDGGLLVHHPKLGNYRFHADSPDARAGRWLFTENETNHPAVFGIDPQGKYTKDAFHRHLVDGEKGAVAPRRIGTKAAPHFRFSIPPGESVTVRCRLHQVDSAIAAFDQYDETFAARISEADEFYARTIPPAVDEEERRISRQGYAGLLWTKQFYYYAIDEWLEGDENAPPPPKERLKGRNHDWHHFHARDILSMPDKWEYPWFAAWDTAFHMIPFAKIDPSFAKHQMLLLLREWYMHPNGQLPAYEWNFSDVNPPVHAWAVWRVYKIADPKGSRDLIFLERCFQKLLLNFTWWVNRKDADGNHVFGGGFLGLDNIGVFDRSHALPDGSKLYQADGTAWMGGYCLTMLTMALELAEHNRAYEDIASKFFEHFVSITDAINSLDETGLWDEQDGFYYDQLIFDDGSEPQPLRTRSLVGLLPLCATTVLKQKHFEMLPDFKHRVDWFLAKRPELVRYLNVKRYEGAKNPGRCLLAIPTEERLRKCLERLVDPDEFLSDFGIRSLSKAHEKEPFVFECGGRRNEVRYTPGESDTDMFGGNSNWRGPIWFPTNYLIIEALQRYHYYYGDDFTIEYPKGSGKRCNLREIAADLSERLMNLFKPGANNQRPCFGDATRYAEKDDWKNLLLFHEYFHAETGEGLGASHQTGWTSLVVRLIREQRRS